MLLAILLGGAIGYEREKADKPAGLRTHMFVTAATTLIVGIGSTLVNDVSIDQGILRADPLRLIEAVVSGITFLGAGTILRRKDETAVEGLTTAASLLYTTAIGITVALNEYVLAVGGTLLALFVLRGLKVLPIEADD